jgi:DNA-directed RNA polymerase specialized sigma24 family protein
MGAVLTLRQLKAVSAVFYEGKTHSQLAAQFGVKPQAIKKRLARARKKMANAGVSLPSQFRRGRVQSLHPDLLRSI